MTFRHHSDFEQLVTPGPCQRGTIFVGLGGEPLAWFSPDGNLYFRDSEFEDMRDKSWSHVPARCRLDERRCLAEWILKHINDGGDGATGNNKPTVSGSAGASPANGSPAPSPSLQEGE